MESRLKPPRRVAGALDSSAPTPSAQANRMRVVVVVVDAAGARGEDPTVAGIRISVRLPTECLITGLQP